MKTITEQEFIDIIKTAEVKTSIYHEDANNIGGFLGDFYTGYIVNAIFHNNIIISFEKKFEYRLRVEEMGVHIPPDYSEGQVIHLDDYTVIDLHGNTNSDLRLFDLALKHTDIGKFHEFDIIEFCKQK